MRVRTSAPGKLVVLGEYAVLTGATALVAAVDRRCEVSLALTQSAESSVRMLADDDVVVRFAAAAPSQLPLVDTVRFNRPHALAQSAVDLTLDSRHFFASTGHKLGLGSSAAVLTALAAAYDAFANSDDKLSNLNDFIALHRALQDGRGSGIDVAAAYQGGLVRFRLDADGAAEVGSVRLPNSVGFAGIFVGRSAKTSTFVGRFEAWRREEPTRAAPLLAGMNEVSLAGCDAAAADDASAFLDAVGAYGELLESLGDALGCDVLTEEHRQVAALADRFAIKYKTSGAGGGDLGIAFSQDAAAMAALREAVTANGFLWVDFSVDPDGLVIEELTE